MASRPSISNISMAKHLLVPCPTLFIALRFFLVRVHSLHDNIADVFWKSASACLSQL